MEASTAHASVPDMARTRCRAMPPERVIAHTPEGPAWQAHTARAIWDEVVTASAGLLASGLSPGARVGILAETSLHWANADLASLAAGGVVVGIYPTLTPQEVAYILDHAAAEVVFVDNPARVERLREALEHTEAPPPLMVCFSSGGVGPGQGEVVSWDQLLERGRDALAQTPDIVDDSIDAIRPEDRAAIIYTSGTTGRPKGVLLTHANFLGVLVPTISLLALDEESRALAFLPLAHVLQRTAGYTGVLAAVTAWFADDMSRVPDVMAEVRPQTLASVPRMFERIYAGIQSEVERLPRRRQRAFAEFVAASERCLEAERSGRRPRASDRLTRALGERLAFRRIRQKLGADDAQYFVGGAPMPRRLLSFFHAIGMPVYEGYGLSETSSQISFNTPEACRLGSVGRLLPGSEARIAEDGEIQLRGPGVFQGYYRNPEATAAAFTEDGWFRTGDLGRLDQDGFLYITGRLKELLITAGGKNVAPVPIEASLTAAPLFGQAVVVGDRRPCLMALLVPDEDVWPAWAEERGLDPTLPAVARLPSSHPLHQAAAEAVAQANASLPRYAQLKDFAVLGTPFSVESGELTPTLKLKRAAIAEARAGVVDRLYGTA